MVDLAFRILNVFAVPGDRLSGNPLCVFEDARSLDDAAMQALALQFNLSETTFLLPASAPGATARVRIFTPAFEMPFAGHPTLGTAHVARAVLGAGDRVVLDMKAGFVEVTARDDNWTLRTARPPEARPHDHTRAEIAAMLRLPEEAIASVPMWVDTGSEQLVIPLASVEHVKAAHPDADLLDRLGRSPKRGASLAYVWARASPDEIVSRFFFLAGGVREDPATGSACANLGGWMIATGAPMPVRVRVRQGDAVNRPSILGLHVDAEKRVFVSGQVVEIARGTLTL
ncbi:MAG TPA: PhzF family phenazine biosynthesis protein [Polyangiaceae bacterium]|nr:PhzF family phenazine biosynthesis protein [Polyangiaceae bacterium]